MWLANGLDVHGHQIWVASGHNGRLIAIAPEHRLVVAIGSVPTNDMATGPNAVWPLVNEVIVPALA
jgi:hypothetical protein